MRISSQELCNTLGLDTILTSEFIQLHVCFESSHLNPRLPLFLVAFSDFRMSTDISTTPLIKTLMFDLSSGKVSLIKHPSPAARPNTTEHLIQVHATALCARERTWPTWVSGGPDKELVPGYDLAGTVVSAPQESPFQPGEEVYTRTNYYRTANAREYSVALTEELALKPRILGWAEAATVPLSAMTAWQALFVHGGLAPIRSGTREEGESARSMNKGKRVLVTAASGGAGNWAVQLAKLAGCEVVGTCGTDNLELVKSLGADEVVDYRTTDLQTWAEADDGRKADVVIDGVGGKTLEQCWSAVKDGGILMSIVEPPEQRKSMDWEETGVKASFWIMEPNGEQLKAITNLIEEGKARPILDSVYPMEEFERAFEKADGGHARGKVVLKITD